MATSQLDRMVKGAPPPNVSPDQVASAARRSSNTPSLSSKAPQPPVVDPTSNLPSSPPQIYLNLLILETSLRAQYLSLRARLRLHLLLLGALALWTLVFAYLLFLRPREDGSGTGGSVYWVVDTFEKMGFVGGTVTWCLVLGTGMWDRSIRWPRRWVGVTNRGLRGFNLKVFIIRGPLWKEAVSYLSVLDPMSWWPGTRGMRYEWMPKDVEKSPGSEKDKLKKWEDGGRHAWVEEDVAPGGDVIRLLLLPKPFSPDFREEWDTFRTNYWDKENARRASLRALIKARDRATAKKEGGWLWWTGWRGWNRLRGATPIRPETTRTPREASLRERFSNTQLRDRRRQDGGLGSESAGGHSRSSSRSSTPTQEPDGRLRRAGGDHMRRGSSSQGAAGRKKKSLVASSAPSSPVPVAVPSFTPTSSRPTTPNPGNSAVPSITSPSKGLAKRASSLSVDYSSEGEIKREVAPMADVEVKQETTP